jgi:hypothetical protein
MKCLNCDDSALFVYENPTVEPQPFCNAHLPSFMRPLAKAGLLTTTDAYAEIKKSTLESLAAPTADDAPVPARKRRGKREVDTTDGSTTDGTDPDSPPVEDVPVVEEDPEVPVETPVAE